MELEKQGRWPEALESWKSCAAADPFCARRVTFLEPMAADNFAGWKRLVEVRRNYRTQDRAQAIAEMEAALAADPQGPTSGQFRQWLVNEYARQGQLERAEQLGVEPEALESMLMKTARQNQRRRQLPMLLGGISGVIFGVGLFLRGALAWKSAILALVLLGGVPLTMAWLYDGLYIRSFSASALLIGGSVLLQARLPLPLLLPAFWLGMLAISVDAGWLG